MSPDILLLVVAGALLIFMFWSTSRRKKKMQEEESKRQASMLPGARVMTRSGLYGTLVAFDADDLTRPAVIEIAPGVEVEVHAQTVVLDPDTSSVDDEHELDGSHDDLDDERDAFGEHDAVDSTRDDAAADEPSIDLGSRDDAQDDDKKQ